MEKVPGMLSVTPTGGLVVVSVMLTPVYVADASSSFCPFGQVMSEGGGWIVSDAVTFPFLPELNDPAALTGPLTVVLFWALGFAPPLLTQTQVAVPSALAT